MKMFAKNTICRNIAKASGVTYKDIRAIFELLIEQIKTGLVKKGRVQINGFGVFYFTDVTFKSKVCKKVVFRSSRALRELFYKKEIKK